LPSTTVPGRGTSRRRVPGVDLGLLHAEADLLLVLVDLEDDDFDFVADADDLGRVVDAAGPAHLGDVDQALDAVFELHERAVGHDVDDLARDARADRVALPRSPPTGWGLLLEAQGDLLFLAVDVEDLDLDLLVDLDHLGRVVDPAPGHVGDVQQAVDAAEVDERAEVGDVLDRALDELALLEGLHQLGRFASARSLFDELAAADDDVAALGVDLEDLGADLLADELADVVGAADVDLRGGQEDRHADVDQQAALDLPHAPALDGVAFLGLDDALPGDLRSALRLESWMSAALALDAFEEDIDLVADLDRSTQVRTLPC
jgi:hypothetical protein